MQMENGLIYVYNLLFASAEYEFSSLMTNHRFKMKHIFIITTILSLISSQVMAFTCDQAITQQEMNSCANQSYKISDQKLNKSYLLLLKKSKDLEYKNALKQAQRSWLKFRDDQCKLVALPTQNGSAHYMVYINCLAEKTDQRIDEIHHMLTCEEGDLSCALF